MGTPKGDLCGEGAVLYFHGGGSYMNLHVEMKELKLVFHCRATNHQKRSLKITPTYYLTVLDTCGPMWISLG